MGSRTTRREVLFGAVALGFTTTIPANAADDAALLTMGRQLHRLRRRCQRLQRQVGDADDPMAWARWSQAVDQQAELIERISRSPVNGITGVVVRYQALASELLDGDLVLDDGARRRIVALSRALRKIVPRAG